jgi:hypothetical protein
MPKFIVTVAVTATEYYSVEAPTESDAWDQWYDGELLSSENHDYEAIDIKEFDE